MSNFDSINRVGQPPTGYVPGPVKKKRRKSKWWLVLIILLIAGIWATNSLLSRTNQIFTKDNNILSRLGRLLVSDDKPLKGEENGMVNVLLLGYGGAGHEGPYLTDTMIVASINTKTNDVILTSIPRDFWVDLGSLGASKINAAYAYNLSEKDPNAAGDAAIAAAEQVTGLEIPYFAAVDFQGFTKAVDHVGGLNINVENTFTDSQYPDSNYGYMPVTFTKGFTHMDGNRALIFARSRHGNNGEGSDFARSERQKKILLSFKEKVLELNLTDFKTLNNLLSDFTENFRTNIEPHELKRLGTLTKNINQDTVYSFSLEPQGTLICNGSIYLDPKTYNQVPAPPSPAPSQTPTPTPTPKPASTKPSPTPTTKPTEEETVEEVEEPTEPQPLKIYVVEPCAGKTLSDIHAYVEQSPIIARLKKESATLEVQNSTGRTGLAANTYGKLSDLGVDLQLTAFRGTTAYTQTIFYDNSRGTKPRTLEYLKNNFKFTISDVGYPSSSADFVIIMGKDALP